MTGIRDMCVGDAGVRERLGELNGKWRNVVFVERRSQAVGA